jgi:biopolymer transport protein ExbD/biopolymer transport protein TolR
VAIAARNEGAKVNSNINVTPMVDVMLVLLIIFMVVIPMIHPGPEIKLAKTENPLEMRDADKEDALLVAVNKDGKLFFGNNEVSSVELTQKVKDRIASRTDRRVFVRADARAHFRFVAEAVDNVRAAGVDELGLLTEQRRR